MAALSDLYRSLFQRLRGKGLGLGIFNRLHRLFWEGWLQPEWVETNGYKLYLPAHDPALADCLRMGGTWEPEMVAEFRTRLAPGMTVLDLGANVGYYTMLASRLVGSGGRVLAFEPDPDNAAILARNKEVNGCANVDIHNCAVGAENGKIRMHLSSSPACHSIAMDPDEGFGTREVDVVSLDAFLAGRARPNALKMDIEGSEREALKGMAGLLRDEALTVMFVECHEDTMRKAGVTAEEVLAPIRAAGFQIRYVDTHNVLCVRGG